MRQTKKRKTLKVVTGFKNRFLKLSVSIESCVCSINENRNPTRHKTNLQLSRCNYQENRKGPLYSGVKIFNRLPTPIATGPDIKFFKPFVNQNTFYNIIEVY